MLLLYFFPHLQSTVSGSLPYTWPCDGVCIGWQSCFFVSQGVWWLSVCQTKMESHRCSWHRQQTTLSYWSCSHSKIMSFNGALQEGTLTNESLFCCNIMCSVQSFPPQNNKEKLSFKCRNSPSLPITHSLVYPFRGSENPKQVASQSQGNPSHLYWQQFRVAI